MTGFEMCKTSGPDERSSQEGKIQKVMKQNDGAIRTVSSGWAKKETG